MDSGKFVTGVSIGVGIAAGAMLVMAFLKAKPAQAGVAAIPPTPASTTSVQGPLYDTLTGVAGITPIQSHPDTYGTSIAPTNPN